MVATLRIDHCPAPWMLTGPALATAYNLAYPCALARLGVPASALTGPQAWEDWLLARPQCRHHAPATRQVRNATAAWWRSCAACHSGPPAVAVDGHTTGPDRAGQRGTVP
ncbi:hypothetical protein GCM10018790_80980 [Kitasatospora xanthocidica]|uniref:hypothetical protein n=1 Tax=Kitasatospora xanthocidica TaxID=83382 RepID=UPI0016798AC9|nr:hypothetical protein [Kitasatospora xanthocidica]GHF91685.1 hypothetical protein GCM10018790_80980 [Kitasatospora xanthocidica]